MVFTERFLFARLCPRPSSAQSLSPGGSPAGGTQHHKSGPIVGVRSGKGVCCGEGGGLQGPGARGAGWPWRALTRRSESTGSTNHIKAVFGSWDAVRAGCLAGMLEARGSVPSTRGGGRGYVEEKSVCPEKVQGYFLSLFSGQ